MCMYACQNGLRNYQTSSTIIYILYIYMFKKTQGQYGNRLYVFKTLPSPGPSQILKNCLKLFKNCLKLFKNCLKLFKNCLKLFKNCLKLFNNCFKLFNNCFKLFKNCLKLFKNCLQIAVISSIFLKNVFNS